MNQSSAPARRRPLRVDPINNLIILDGAEQIGHGRQDRVDTAVKGRAPVRSVINACIPGRKVASSVMTDQSLSDQAREAVLRAIIKSAPSVGNSPAGVRDLAEAYALLERNLIPNAGVVQTRT